MDYAEQDILNLIEHLAGDIHCPLCSERYLRDDIRVVRIYGKRWTLSVQCDCCGTGSLITATVLRDSDPTECCRNELTPAELQRFASVAPVSTDDVLDLHLYLKQFQGDILSLGLGLSSQSPG